MNSFFVIFTKLTTMMGDRTHISRKEDDHYFVSSHSDLVKSHNISGYTLSNQPSVIKRFYHRSHRHKLHNLKRRQKRFNAVIHVAIRPLSTSHLTENKIINPHSNLPLTKQISAIENFQHQERDSSKLPVIRNIPENSKSALHSVNITHVRRHQHSSSQKLEQQNDYARPSLDIDQQNNQEMISKSKSFKISYPDDKISIDQRHKKRTRDIWPDGTDMTKDHHQILKKRKKKICSRRCVIASILIALMIIIILAVILPIVLIKAKTVTTSTLVPLLRWNTTGITLVGLSGMPGNASNQLNRPKDATLVYPNILYIADTLGNRIQKHIINDLYGTTVAGQADGIGGSSASHLNSPSCVRIDSNGGLYIADTNNNRIQFWSNGASSGLTIAGNGTSGLFNTTNQLSLPYGIDRDINSGTLYIGDYGNHRVTSNAPDFSPDIVVAGGNGPGKNNTHLYFPSRLYFDSLSNSLVITQHIAHNIVRWVLGASSWTLLVGDSNGNPGSNSTQLRFPMDATFDPMGNMYVADKDNHRIQLFMADQSEGITIAGVPNVFGNTSTLLSQPWSVKLDNQLNLYVADSRNHRIQKFVRY